MNNPSHHRKANAHVLPLKLAMRQTFECTGLPHKALAYDLGVDSATVSKYLGDEYHLVLPCDLLPIWTRSTGDAALLRLLAMRSGYEIVPAEGDHPVVRAAVPHLLALLASKSGSTMGHLIAALEDGKLSAEERKELGPELMRLRSVVDALYDQVNA